MLKNLSIQSRLVFVIGFLSILLIAVGTIGLSSLGASNISLKNIYEKRLVPIGQLDLVVRMIDKNRMTVAESMNGDPAVVIKKMDEVEKRVVDVNKQWETYFANTVDADEKKLAMKFFEARKKFLSDGLKPTVEALRASNVQQAMELMQGAMSQYYEPMQAAMDALIKLQQDVAKNEFEKRQEIYSTVRNTSIASMVFGVLLATAIGLCRTRLL